jgi:RNA-directed DNA polymerase
MTGGEFMKTEEGTPQGGNLSPLLSNIMLHELDCELEKRGLQFCRYADDCNIYVKSEKAANRVMKSITRFIEVDLKLKVNQEKSSVDRPWNLKFLGFTVCYSNPKGMYVILPHKKSIKKFKAKLKELTSRKSGISMEIRLGKIAQAIRGWVSYFRISSLSSIAKELDGWLRRRIRMCIWKSWKCISNQYANLVKLGANREKAWMFTNWRKGYWEKSYNPMLHETLTTKYLANLGLVSILATYSGKR